MATEANEEDLKNKAMEYLRSEYHEETVRMEVRSNSVESGNGELHVDCTVRIGGSESDWTKWFTFKDGEVTNMRWTMR